MSNSTIQDFFHQFPKQTYKKGEVILGPTHSVESIFYLESGEVRMFGVSVDGRESIIHTFQKGSYFPMMILLGHGVQNYYFDAITLVTVYKAPAHEVEAFIQNNPEIMHDLLVNFARGLNGMALRIEHLLSQNSYTKVAGFLIYVARKYGKKIPEGIRVDQKISHTELGSWLGLTRETVSRQIEELEKKKIIKYLDSYIEICDLNALRTQAKED